jgi:hypothetical protein
MSGGETIIKNLDQGMFYAFSIMSLYFIKAAYVEFNNCVEESLVEKKFVDRYTQTYSETDLVSSENQYEHVIEHVEVEPTKRRFLGLW